MLVKRVAQLVNPCGVSVANGYLRSAFVIFRVVETQGSWTERWMTLLP